MRKLRSSHIEDLRALIGASVKRSGDLRFLHRLHCVLLASEGPGCYVVARWFGEDPRTIERWLNAFERHGPDGLKDRPHGGRPSRLATHGGPALEQEIAAAPRASGYDQARWNGALLAQHLEARHGIRLSARQCQRILRQLGAAPPPA